MITLKDKLSHLSYIQACKLLGPQGKHLILQGGKFDVDPFEQVTLNNQWFSLNLEGARVHIVEVKAQPVLATLLHFDDHPIRRMPGLAGNAPATVIFQGDDQTALLIQMKI